MPEWIATLIGALVGGALSCFGAALAIDRQIKAQRREFDETARTFFEFVVSENIRRIENLQQYRSANSGALSLFDLNMMAANYQTFERNREHIVRLQTPDRDAISEEICRAQVLATAVLSAEQDRQTANAKIQTMANDPYKNVESQKEQAARKIIDEAFANFPMLLDRLKGAREKLRSLKKA